MMHSAGEKESRVWGSGGQPWSTGCPLSRVWGKGAEPRGPQGRALQAEGPAPGRTQHAWNSRETVVLSRKGREENRSGANWHQRTLECSGSQGRY